MTTTEERAAMSSAAINDLPDSAFAHIEPGGTKDAGGKTVPRSLRHYPVHDKAHAKNALGRAQAQINGGDADAKRIAQAAMPKIKAAAKKFGIEVSDSTSAQRDVKWEQRRRRWAGSLIRQRARRSMHMEVRAKPDGTGGTNFEFEGYGAVFDTPFRMWDPWGDEYREVVRPGAFTRSLRNPDLYVPFLLGHDDKGIALAQTANKTMRLSQDTHGMHVLALMDGRRSDVRNLAYAVERGDQDQMSVSFVTMEQDWSPDWEQRSMLDLELHEGDVSSVAIAANSATAGSTMTALPAEILSRQAAARRAEQRGNPVDQDLGDAPDYNPQGMTSAHAFTGTHSHPHTDGDGGVHDHQHAHDGDADHDHDHGGDALVTISNDGVPAMEESQGAAASLALRRRQLELLRLSGRTEAVKTDG